MRPWIAAPALLCVALAATAQEAQTESVAEVEFQAEQILFRGTDQVYRFPEGQAIGMELRADVAADATGVLAGLSKMVWPEAMTQGWVGEPAGGELSVDLSLDLDLSVVVDGEIDAGITSIDFSANPLRYGLWDDSFTWTVSQYFDTFLLPGAPMPSVAIRVDETSGSPAYQWFLGSRELNLGAFGDCDYYLTIGGSLEVAPDSTFILTGQQIVTRGRAVTAHGETVVVPPPTSNPGAADFQSLWQGEVTSDFALVLGIVPSVLFECEKEDGTREDSLFSDTIEGMVQGWLSELYRWDIAEDTRPFQSKNTAYTHPLPAIATSDDRLDFGAVRVGEDAQLNLVVEDLGDIPLTGEITLTGDAVFAISRPDIDIDGGGDATFTITFSPDASGDYEGELVLTTNDPVNDEVVIPLSGNGFEDGEDTGGLGDTGPVETGRRGCGCDAGSVAPLAGWSLLGLPLFLGLRRRR